MFAKGYTSIRAMIETQYGILSHMITDIAYRYQTLLKQTEEVGWGTGLKSPVILGYPGGRFACPGLSASWAFSPLSPMPRVPDFALQIGHPIK